MKNRNFNKQKLPELKKRHDFDLEVNPAFEQCIVLPNGLVLSQWLYKKLCAEMGWPEDPRELKGARELL